MSNEKNAAESAKRNFKDHKMESVTLSENAASAYNVADAMLHERNRKR